MNASQNHENKVLYRVSVRDPFGLLQRGRPTAGRPLHSNITTLLLLALQLQRTFCSGRTQLLFGNFSNMNWMLLAGILLFVSPQNLQAPLVARTSVLAWGIGCVAGVRYTWEPWIWGGLFTKQQMDAHEGMLFLFNKVENAWTKQGVINQTLDVL